MDDTADLSWKKSLTVNDKNETILNTSTQSDIYSNSIVSDHIKHSTASDEGPALISDSVKFLVFGKRRFWDILTSSLTIAEELSS